MGAGQTRGVEEFVASAETACALCNRAFSFNAGREGTRRRIILEAVWTL